MAKGKFSQPRVPKSGASADDQATQRIILPDEPSNDLSMEDTIHLPSEQSNAFPLAQAAPQNPEPVIFNQDAAGLDYVQQLAQEGFFEESDEDFDEQEPESFTETLLAFFAEHQKGVLAGVCGVALVLIIVVISLFLFSSSTDPYDGKILSNVTIAGVNVGGMTKSEAEDAVHAATDNTYTQTDMVVVMPETELVLSPVNTKADLDVESAVQAAYDYGRTGTKAEKEAAFSASLTGNHTIGLLPYLNLDEDYIQDVLNEYAGQFDSIYTEASYELEGDIPALEVDKFDADAPCQTLVLTMGTPGINLDIDGIYNDILDAYSLHIFVVNADTEIVETVPEEPDLDTIYAEVYIAPVDSTMDMQSYKTIPGSYGYGFDLEAAQKLVDAADYGESIRIPMEYIEPDVLDDQLLYLDVLGSCETKYTQNTNRTSNLKLACEKLNGLVLKPGETFSFNTVVGERTTAKGYKSAPAYYGTSLVDVVGGGVSQCSSTLYYCALLADLDIVDRTSHDVPVSYMDYGMDADVQWGSTDLKFRNNTNYPIKIEAEVSGGYVSIKILGTEERDYYVKMEYVITNTYDPETKYEVYTSDNDKGYTDGQVLVAGSSGYYIKTYKLKYSRETNKLLSRDFEANSQYEKVNRVVVRIEDPEETIPETTTPPETTVPPETTIPTESTEPTEATETTEPVDSISDTEPTQATDAPSET